MALTDKLTNIADTIRSKTGGTDLLTLDQMVTEIENLQIGIGGYKVEFGSFTPASDSGTKGYVVNHSLGKIPSIIAFYTDTNVPNHYNKAGVSMANINSNGFIASGSYGTDMIISGDSTFWGNSSSRYGSTCCTIREASSTHFKIGYNRNYTRSVGCKAGVTYYWVAIAEAD